DSPLRNICAAVLILTSGVVASGCRLLSMVAPSALWRIALPAWSPYIVVQPDTAAVGGYRDALTSLVNRGAIQGARIGLFGNGSSGPVVQLVASLGIEILGIVDNADLFRPDVQGAFDRY